MLDGHIVLSRRLAAGKHFPAIDVLESVSRVRDDVIDPLHLDAAAIVFRAEAAYRHHEDLLAVGAYKPGADRQVDAAIAHRQEMLGFLRQQAEEETSYDAARLRLIELAGRLQAHQNGRN